MAETLHGDRPTHFLPFKRQQAEKTSPGPWRPGTFPAAEFPCAPGPARAGSTQHRETHRCCPQPPPPLPPPPPLFLLELGEHFCLLLSKLLCFTPRQRRSWCVPQPVPSRLGDDSWLSWEGQKEKQLSERERERRSWATSAHHPSPSSSPADVLKPVDLCVQAALASWKTHAGLMTHNTGIAQSGTQRQRSRSRPAHSQSLANLFTHRNSSLAVR